jgi:hypothetical protein
MIGDIGANSESIVLMTENDQAIFDYKLIQNNSGKVCFVKTPVFIALRFSKTDNDDIIEKKKLLLKVHMNYIEKRIEKLEQIIRQQTRVLMETSSSISFEFKDTCKMVMMASKRQQYSTPARNGPCDNDIEVLS